MSRLSNGQGTVTKLKGKRSRPYIIQSTKYFDYEAQKYKRDIVGYAKTKTEAYMILAEFNLKNPNLQDANNIRLIDLYKYVLERKARVVSEKRLYNIDSYFNNIMGEFMNRTIASLKYLEIQNHIENFGSTTVTTVIGLLKEIYKEALKRDIVTKDISVFLEAPLHKKREKKENFTKGEINFLWSEYNNNKNKYASILLIQLYSGCRVSEVIKLKVSDIDFNNMVFQTGVKTKAGIDRYIPIHNEILKIFNHFIDNCINYNLFNSIKLRNINRYLEKVKINKTTHIARHTFITNMQILDAPLKDLQYIVGHKSQDITTKTYTHLGIETAIKMIKWVNKLEY